MSINDLLQRNRFQAHPFETWIAEDEQHLRQWFVPPPFLESLIGSYGAGPARVASDLVFGRPGSGKTALRLTLERELLRRVPNALVLRYVDFSGPLSTAPTPTLAAHVEEILRLGTVGLIGLWLENQDRFYSLDAELRKELAGLIQRYYETLSAETRQVYARSLSRFQRESAR